MCERDYRDPGVPALREGNPYSLLIQTDRLESGQR